MQIPASRSATTGDAPSGKRDPLLERRCRTSVIIQLTAKSATRIPPCCANRSVPETARIKAVPPESPKYTNGTEASDIRVVKLCCTRCQKIKIAAARHTHQIIPSNCPHVYLNTEFRRSRGITIDSTTWTNTRPHSERYQKHPRIIPRTAK